MTDIFDFGEEIIVPVKSEIKPEQILSIQKIKTVSVLGKTYEVNVE